MLLLKYFKDNEGRKQKKESQTEENSGQNAPVPEAVTGSTSGSSADGIMPHLALIFEDSKQNLTAKTSADKEKRTRKYGKGLSLASL